MPGAPSGRGSKPRPPIEAALAGRGEELDIADALGLAVRQQAQQQLAAYAPTLGLRPHDHLVDIGMQAAIGDHPCEAEQLPVLPGRALRPGAGQGAGEVLDRPLAPPRAVVQGLEDRRVGCLVQVLDPVSAGAHVPFAAMQITGNPGRQRLLVLIDCPLASYLKSPANTIWKSSSLKYLRSAALTCSRLSAVIASSTCWLLAMVRPR